jgi:hypothetical protein
MIRISTFSVCVSPTFTLLRDSIDETTDGRRGQGLPENLSRSFTALASHGVMTEGRAIVIKDRGKLQRLVR